MHDSQPPHDEPPAPQALDAAGAASLSALGASAPLDNVVSLNTARRAGSDDASESSGGAGASPSAPPPPLKGASARSVGEGAKRAGAGKAEDKPKKPEKTIDWGVHNYLVENFVLIYPTDTAWDSAKRKVVKISNMAHMYGSDMVRMWKSSAKRRSIDEDLFDGMPMKPKPCTEADVAVMLELLRHLCSRCATKGVTIDEVMRWVLCWLALPLQQPGAKPRTALVFHGPQGTGKNLFFDAVRAIYGKYGVMVGQTQLEEKYNGWLSAKLLILGNEVVSRQELYHNKNQLKWVISEEEIPIRTMQTDTRWERNHANVVFLSNESKPLVLEVDDRRYLVVYTPVGEDGDALEDFISSEESPSPVKEAFTALQKEELRQALEQLDYRERRILELRYGLHDNRTRTLEDVGKEFNISRERVRQIEKEALEKLRAMKLRERLKRLETLIQQEEFCPSR